MRTRLDRLASIAGRRALQWINVEGVSNQRNGASLFNEVEIDAVLETLVQLSAEVAPTASIGVCAPFRAHIDAIKVRAKGHPVLRALMESDRLLIDTVHKFQGNERDVMVFSPVISCNASEGSKLFLSKSRNIFNVAVTRARAHLVVVGDKGVCSGSNIDFLKRFVEYSDRQLDDVSMKQAVAVSSTCSDDEAALAALLRSANIAAKANFTIDQYRIPLAVEIGEGRVALEVDVEVENRLANSVARRDDMALWDRLRELGWSLVRVAPHEITEFPERVIARVIAAQ